VPVALACTTGADSVGISGQDEGQTSLSGRGKFLSRSRTELECVQPPVASPQVKPGAPPGRVVR
jgi:hypothetical protein